MRTRAKETNERIRLYEDSAARAALDLADAPGSVGYEDLLMADAFRKAGGGRLDVGLQAAPVLP